MKGAEEGLGRGTEQQSGAERRSADAFLEEQDDYEFGRSVVCKSGKSET